jgi:hypothetical protein
MAGGALLHPGTALLRCTKVLCTALHENCAALRCAAALCIP